MDDKVTVMKFIPHRDLQSNWSFFSINFRSKELVFGIKLAIKKVNLVSNKDGTPILNPKNGEPQLNFDYTPIVQMFTSEEYNKLMMGGRDDGTG